MASKKPRTVPVSVIRDDINGALDTIRKTHLSDPHFCIGYMWATLAGLLEKCGEPKPIAPWRDEK